MRREEARVHAFVWVAAAQQILPRADMDNETARLHRALAALADRVGRCYAAVAEGNHPVTGTALNNE